MQKMSLSTRNIQSSVQEALPLEVRLYLFIGWTAVASLLVPHVAQVVVAGRDIVQEFGVGHV